MKINLQKLVLEEIASVFRPLVTVASRPTNTIRLFEDLGWDVQALLGGDIMPLTTLLTALNAPLDAVRQLAGTPAATSEASFGSFKTALLTTKALGNAVQQLSTLSLAGSVGPQFCADILQKLFAANLFHRHEQAFYFFVLTGVIVPDTQIIQQGGRYVKFGSKIPLFSFSRLLNLLKQPSQQIADTYWPNGLAADLATPASTAVVGQKLFSRLSLLLRSLGIPAAASLEVGPLPTPLSAADIEALKATMYLEQEFPIPGGSAEIGLSVGLLSVAESGPGLFLGPRGAIDLSTKLGDWLVELGLSAQLDVLAFKPSGVEVLGGSGTSGTATLQVSSTLDGDGLIGNQTGTRLQLGQVQVGARLDYTTTSHAVDIYASLAESTLTIHSDEGDSFLNKVIPTGGINVKFNALLGWSSKKGLYFGGKAGLKNTILITNKKIAGFVRINSLTTELQLTDKLAVQAAASGEVTLGPIIATISEVGLAMDLAAAPNGGNAGPFDMSLGFKSPSGVGIKVESDLVTGGGYLFLDAAHHMYAGAANLTLALGKSDINLNALGLLQTELPGNPDAYSLLLLITATFTPIQLGLGFTLNGLGGLLGINRAADTTYLRGLVRGGQLDKLLFPTNVMANPADALATVDAAFPATEGRYIIGLLGELGWGVPANLITLDVALLVELPSPVRLLILGVLQASLPSKTNELLKLRADFLGSIDFGAKKVAFDAALSESKILVYSLTGDMAFRLYQGDNPVFLISAGGFHPQFQPPAGADLPAMRRLTLALAQGNDLRITLASYFAVTSNTVQFGAHLDLYLNLRLGLQAEGHFGLDTLFQFNPFRLLAHVDAGVSIKRGNSELLGLHLSLDVTGPGPWHVWGEASFKIWFVKISVDVNATIGDTPNGVPIAAPDVRTPLLAALNSAAAWTVEAPATAQPGGVVLRPANVDAGQVFLDPRGTLVVSQRVAPLGLELARYGNGVVAPTGGNRFDLLSLTVGTTSYPSTDADHVEVVRDFFAPDQFQNLSNGDRLNLPSFQLQPNGLRLKGLSYLTAGATPTATRRVVQYERLLREGAATGTISGGSLTPLAFGRLARGGALGQRYQAAQPSARAAQLVGWAATTYAVVLAADLTVYQGQDKIGSQAEAEQYRRAQPTAADLLVVPTYQLELA